MTHCYAVQHIRNKRLLQFSKSVLVSNLRAKVMAIELHSAELNFLFRIQNFKYSDHWLLNDTSDVKNVKKEKRTLPARVNKMISCFYNCLIKVKCLLKKSFVHCLLGIVYRHWIYRFWEKLYICI